MRVACALEIESERALGLTAKASAHAARAAGHLRALTGSAALTTTRTHAFITVDTLDMHYRMISMSSSRDNVILAMRP